jgi:hypothetical protein
MASFSEEMAKALKIVTGKQIQRASRAALKKFNPDFEKDMYKEAKKFGLLRSFATFVKRMKFGSTPKETNQGVTQSIFVRDTQFTFLAFPAKIKQFRRKNGTFGKRRIVEGVKVGTKFRSYQGISIANFNGREVPVRSKRGGGIESMKVNIYNIIANNESNFENATDDYAKNVMVDIGKRMIRAAARKLNKRVRFKVQS